MCQHRKNRRGEAIGKDLIVDLKDCDIVETTNHFIQVNHLIEKLKTKNPETKKNLFKAKFMFMVEIKSPIHKTSVDPKMQPMKICVRNNRKKETPKILSGF